MCFGNQITQKLVKMKKKEILFLLFHSDLQEQNISSFQIQLKNCFLNLFEVIFETNNFSHLFSTKAEIKFIFNDCCVVLRYFRSVSIIEKKLINKTHKFIFMLQFIFD
jgi:hypothetical protein